MADFPASKKNFSDLVDGTTYMEATNVNQTYDEIEAVETLIGALGAGNTQSYSASILELLEGYRKGARVTYKDADEVTAAAGMILFEAAGKFRLRVNSTSTDIGWADIDTGSEANTTYYVYATADDEETTFNFCISTNSSTPTGFTYYKRIGTFMNVAGDIAEYSVQDDSVVTDYSVPKGGIIMWKGAITQIPEGWTICDGTSGTPDLSDRFVIHADADSGGTNDVGDTGGEHTHVLTEAEMPSHNHTKTMYQVSGTGVHLGQTGITTNPQTMTTDNTGSGSAHENRPKYYALAYIMKT